MGIKEFEGYRVDAMEGCFRSLQIIKNRDGDRGGRVGLKFGGSVGLFEELPCGLEMTSENYQSVLTI